MQRSSFRHHLGAGIGVALLVGMAACSQEQVDWKQAESRDSVGIYQAFIKAHPQSEHVATAKQRIDELRFERVKAQDSPFQYRRFVAKYPDSRHAEEARQRAAELEIGAAMRVGTAQALQAILKLHPKGKHVAEARAKLARLYPPFTGQSVLSVAGVGVTVEPGQAVVESDESGKTCRITSGGPLAVAAGKTCGMLCREQLKLGPEVRLPVAWIEPTATSCAELRLSTDFSVRLQRSCKSGADETRPEAALGYIVAGVQGAVLQKHDGGYRLVQGQANYLKPSAGQKPAQQRPDPEPPHGKVTSGSAACKVAGGVQTRGQGAEWVGSEGGWK